MYAHDVGGKGWSRHFLISVAPVQRACNTNRHFTMYLALNNSSKFNFASLPRGIDGQSLKFYVYLFTLRGASTVEIKNFAIVNFWPLMNKNNGQVPTRYTRPTVSVLISLLTWLGAQFITSAESVIIDVLQKSE